MERSRIIFRCQVLNTVIASVLILRYPEVRFKFSMAVSDVTGETLNEHIQILKLARE